ncbi:uncharacterized protein [Procambarus clarkii]|uniref:uncharacterized protein n=1 Tax=Procambarus clarkii TaxID=6728 RepID=UPI003743E34F
MSCRLTLSRSLLALASYMLVGHLEASNYLFQKVSVDKALPVFTKCPPIPVNITNDRLSRPMLYCIIACSQQPTCNFVAFEGEFCMLHTVVLATGYNVAGSPSTTVKAYRPSTMTTPPLALTASVSATTDLFSTPTFSSSLIQGNIWCWVSVYDCPCTADQVNQKVIINLGSPIYIRQFIVYPTVPGYTSYSISTQIHVGNAGGTGDPLLIDEQRPYGSQEYYRVYPVGKTARYITFYKNTGANLCLCKVKVYS